MSKQHPSVKKLRGYQRWRRGGSGEQPAPDEVGKLLDQAIAVFEAADNLVNAKGRHHSEVAYRRLEQAVNSPGET